MPQLPPGWTEGRRWRRPDASARAGIRSGPAAAGPGRRSPRRGRSRCPSRAQGAGPRPRRWPARRRSAPPDWPARPAPGRNAPAMTAGWGPAPEAPGRTGAGSTCRSGTSAGAGGFLPHRRAHGDGAGRPEGRALIPRPPLARDRAGRAKTAARRDAPAPTATLEQRTRRQTPDAYSRLSASIGSRRAARQAG